MKNKRLYGLDILRIFSMVLITVIHYIAYSGIMYQSSLAIYNKVILSVFSGISVVAVNVFVLITGYFSCAKKLNIKRIATLWVHVFVIGIIVTIIAALLLNQQMSITIILKTVFPLSTMHYWFFTMYFVLMLVSPLINYSISNLNEKQHKTICITGFFIICVFFVSNPFINNLYYTASPRGIVWLVYLYFVGAGIRKYEWKLSLKAGLFAAVCILTVVCILKFFKKESIGNIILLEANGVLPFLLSVIIFNLFKCQRKVFDKYYFKTFSMFFLGLYIART